ncbi:MAG: hypothetical protein NVSMB17_16480 [Candidatus Dormibacteria bacterium]
MRDHSKKHAVTALYTRYRSQRFDALVGQEAAVRTLRNAITGGRLAHAYLFTGIRGTGKTSSARILAKAVNCLGEVDGEPDNTCVNCVAINEAAATDLIEIDAASNRGVDEIRDLREKARYLPALLKRKVYIIDEAHQLTNEAFNALLKTLEEPPEHVLFILCTTESHKLPATIISRCQRFDFRRINEADIAARLAWISQQEDLKADPDGLALLASMAQGSMRDAITMLDQMASAAVDTIDAASVRRQLGLVTQRELAEMLVAAARGDAATVLRELDRMAEQGADMRQLASSLAELARRAVLLSIGAGDPAALGIEEVAAATMTEVVSVGGRTFCARAFELAVGIGAEMRQTHDARLLLELTLLKLSTGGLQSVPGAAPATPVPPAAAKPPAPGPGPAPSPPPPVPVAPAPVTRAPASGEGAVSVPREGSEPGGGERVANPPVGAELAGVRGRWQTLLETLRGTAPGTRVRALLKDAAPVALDGDALTLGFRFAMLSEKAQEPLHRAELERALAEVCGRNFRLEFRVTPDLEPTAPDPVRAVVPPPAVAASPVRQPPETGATVVSSLPVEDGEDLRGEQLVDAAVDILGAQITDIQSRPRT